MENRRRFLEKRRDNCAQSINHLIRFQTDGRIPEGDSETEMTDSETVEENKTVSNEQETSEVGEQEALSSDQKNHTPPPEYPRSIQQSVVEQTADDAKDTRSKLNNIPSPPQVQRVTKLPAQTSMVQQKQTSVSQTIQMPLQQALQGGVEGQQYLQIVGSDGKTQLLQIVGNTADQQVFELVSTPGQQQMLKPVSVQKRVQQQKTYGTSGAHQEQIVQYISDMSQGPVTINDQMEEQIIITDGSHQEQVVQEHVVVTGGSQEHVATYSNQLVLNDTQSEHIVVTEGVQEQVVMSSYSQEQVVEEVVMEVPSQVAHREIVVSSNPKTTRPTLQSLLRKQPEIRPKPAVSILKPQIHQQIISGIPMMIVTQGSTSAGSSQPQTIYTMPSAAQTAVVTASPQGPSSSVVVSSVTGQAGQVIQADNIIETAFVAATQGESEAEVVQSDGNSRVAVQVAKQPQVIVQQQPQQQVAVAQGQPGEMMNIDDIEVQPLQASQEDLMRTMESIASELLGVSSIDLAP